MSCASEPAFVLKVDVDTHIGLRDGAPRLLELFARHGVRASWFVAMGPDRTGRAALRVFRHKGFLAKMLRSGAPRLYPVATMLRGTLLPAIPIAAALPERLRQIRAAGHDLGVHGFDHVLWHDRLAVLSPREVHAEIARATSLFSEILGTPAPGFAAPGWQCTATSLRAIDEVGFVYRSDTRGVAPYRPMADGYVGRIPEIPTTLPTLDEMIGIAGRSVDELLGAYQRWIRPDALQVHTVHTEVEGAAWLEHLDRLLGWVRSRLPVKTLAEVVQGLPDPSELPAARVEPQALPGRAGTVATQQGWVGPACAAGAVC